MASLLRIPGAFSALGAKLARAAHQLQSHDYPRVDDPDVVGDFLLPLSVLSRKDLEHLRVLYHARGRGGWTHATNDHLSRHADDWRDTPAGWVRPAESTCSARTRRLARLGFVAQERRWLADGRRMFERLVLGAFVVVGGVEQLCVPAQVVRAVYVAPKNGGRRAGAGRKVGSRDAQPRTRRPPPVVVCGQHLPEHDQPNYTRRGHNMRVLASLPLQSERAQDNQIGGAESYSSSFCVLKKEQPRTEAVRRQVASPLRGSPEPEDQLSLPTSTASNPATGGGGGTTTKGGVGTRLGGLAQGCRPLPASAPLRPTMELVPVAQVPNPPKLAQDASQDAMLDALGVAYLGAVKARYGKPPWNSGTEKIRGAALACAAKLQEHSIAPAAWAAFSCDVWRTYGDGKKPPPARWVWSAKRVEERHGWFSSDLATYQGGNCRFSPSHLELAARWESMNLQCMHAATDEEAEAVVARVLPKSLFDQLAARAREESAKIQADLRRRVERGEFLW